MFRMTLLGCTSALALGLSAPAEGYPIDCAIFLCLAGGWPSDPDCNAARAEFIRRITPMPVEPPLQLWRCPMGVASGLSQLTPMQRLEAIKAVSATPTPELPGEEDAIVVEASLTSKLWSTSSADQNASWIPFGSLQTPLANTWIGSPALPVPTLTSVDLSSADFDVVRSIRVWDVRHYSYRVREREGPCSVRLDMVVGTYDENANFHWSDRALGPRPDWLPLRKNCPSYFRGVGVEWSDIFGRYDYELVFY